MNKRCSRCRRSLDVSQFYKNRSQPDGLQNQCVGCKHEASRKYLSRDYGSRDTSRVGAPRKSLTAEQIIARRRASVKRYHALHPAEWSIKGAARQKAGRALSAGLLVRQPCEMADCAAKSGMHHDDYTKPLAVRWLCTKHHRWIHLREKLDAREILHAPSLSR